MTTVTTTREFVRNFARLQKAADKGGEIIVKDRTGRSYVFRGQNKEPTLGEQLADIRGSLRTGVRVKSLKGYGRNRS